MDLFKRSVGLTGRLRTSLRCWRRDSKGALSVEFALVAGPFLGLVFGVLTGGIHFLTSYSLENAVGNAGRLIRTGQAQAAVMTAAQFKQAVCDNAVNFIKCEKVVVHVQSWDNFTQIQPAACLNEAGDVAGASGDANAPISDSAGEDSKVVLITVCYEWQLAKVLPYLKLANMSNGSELIQASTTFRTEPYK